MNGTHSTKPDGGVRELDLGPDPASGSLEGSETAAVVAGCVIAFDDEVSEQGREDVLHTFLLAQLAANAKADRHKEPLAWYKIHQSTLEQVGWVAFASTGFTRFEAPSNIFTISSVITALFADRSTHPERMLVERVLAAFTRDRASAAQIVWECPSHAGAIGNFQFVLVGDGVDGLVTRVGRFYFEAGGHVTRLAFEDFDRTSRFSSSQVVMRLNESVLERLRVSITDKLGGRLPGSIAALDLDRQPPA